MIDRRQQLGPKARGKPVSLVQPNFLPCDIFSPLGIRCRRALKDLKSDCLENWNIRISQWFHFFKDMELASMANLRPGIIKKGTLLQVEHTMNMICHTSHTGAKIYILSKNSHVQNHILRETTFLKSQFLTKIIFSKSHFSQKSHFRSPFS